MSNTIEWHDAYDKNSKAEQERLEREERDRKEYDENLDRAKDEMWDALGTDDFRTSDFDDICSNYGIDPDDLIDELI